MENELSVCIPSKCDKETLLVVVKALLTLIPEGKVTSYGEISKILGIGPRYLGRLISMNDEPLVYPCHRVVMNNGKIGGYRKIAKNPFKEKLLKFEGVKITGDIIDKSSFVSLIDLLEIKT